VRVSCADLQLVHGFRCYDNIAANAKCQRVLVIAVCLVQAVFLYQSETRTLSEDDGKCLKAHRAD